MKTSDLCFLQVLVPHKNQPEKLIRLLKSIPDEVEVIVVDDNSDRHHFESCKNQIKEKFRNVVLIKNETGINNAGASRNMALAHANAEWIVFADSDDKFYSDKFRGLIDFLKSTSADLVFFDVTATKESDGRKSDRTRTYRGLVEKWPLNRNAIAYQWVVPWGKAIKKRELIDLYDLKFASRSVSNDVEFSTDLASVTKKIDVFTQIVYCCFESSTSLTGTLTAEKARVRLQAASKRNETLLKSRVPIHYNYNVQFFLKSLPLIVKELDFRTVGVFLKNLYVSFVGNYFINVRFR